MTERTFTVTFNAEARLAMLSAIGGIEVLLALNFEDVDKITLFDPIFAVRNALTGAPPPTQEAAPIPAANSGTEAARAVLSPPPAQAKDYFAKNKNGSTPTKPPTGAELS